MISGPNFDISLTSISLEIAGLLVLGKANRFRTKSVALVVFGWLGKNQAKWFGVPTKNICFLHLFDLCNLGCFFGKSMLLLKGW